MVNEQQKCTIHKNALKFLFPPFLTNPPHPKQARQTYGALQTSMVSVVHRGGGGAPIPMQLLTNCARNSTHQQTGPMVHCANSCCISQTMSYGYEWEFMCSQWRPVRPPHAALHSVPHWHWLRGCVILDMHSVDWLIFGRPEAMANIKPISKNIPGNSPPLPCVSSAPNGLASTFRLLLCSSRSVDELMPS